MLKQTIILATIIFTSYVHAENTNGYVDSRKERETVPTSENKTKNALKFINKYVKNSNKMEKAVDVIDWVNSNSLATKNFKTELKRTIDEAYKADPELGLDADPIFDAQDHPDKGFELESFDEKTNYLTVKGKDWPEFRLTMKVVEENGKWLVDGCGMINIPNDKRAKR